MAEVHVGKAQDEMQLQLRAQADLHRGLKNRHVQMIGIGGTIGVGLFLGSATAIQKAGPGLVVSYAIGGLVMFFIMRALGELLLYRPVSGSFAAYAEEFVGPWAGFMTGWLLGWKLLTLDPAKGAIRVEFAAVPDFINSIGTIQGGIITAMLDDAMGPVATSAPWILRPQHPLFRRNSTTRPIVKSFGQNAFGPSSPLDMTGN
jgi:amino acid transporter